MPEPVLSCCKTLELYTIVTDYLTFNLNYKCRLLCMANC